MARRLFLKVADILNMIFACIGFLVVIVVMIAAVSSSQHDSSAESQESQGQITQAQAQTRVIDWDELPDPVVAWVSVPDSNIDQPIVQASADDPDQYLHTDVLGEGNYGTPYIDCDCSLSTPFVLTYGHHMSDGSVFADFSSFNDVHYLYEHQTIYLYTRADNQCHRLKVFAADVIDADSDTVRTDYDTQKDINALVAEVVASSDVAIDAPQGLSQVYAFATCSYQTDNSRTVVYATEEG